MFCLQGLKASVSFEQLGPNFRPSTKVNETVFSHAAVVEPAVIAANVGGLRARLNKINVSTNLSFQAQAILQLK